MTSKTSRISIRPQRLLFVYLLTFILLSIPLTSAASSSAKDTTDTLTGTDPGSFTLSTSASIFTTSITPTTSPHVPASTVTVGVSHTPSPTSTNSSSSSSKSSFPTGAIAGIVVACVAALSLVALWLVLRYRRKNLKAGAETASTHRGGRPGYHGELVGDLPPSEMGERFDDTESGKSENGAYGAARRGYSYYDNKGGLKDGDPGGRGTELAEMGAVQHELVELPGDTGGTELDSAAKRAEADGTEWRESRKVNDAEREGGRI